MSLQPAARIEPEPQSSPSQTSAAYKEEWNDEVHVHHPIATMMTIAKITYSMTSASDQDEERFVQAHTAIAQITGSNTGAKTVLEGKCPVGVTAGLCAHLRTS